MKNVTVLHDTWIPTCKLTDLSLTVLLAAPPCVTSTAAALPVLTVGNQAVIVRALVTRAVLDLSLIHI